MSAPRLRGLSARVDEETYTALCARAKAQGETVSSLVAQLLATGCKTPPPAVRAEDEEERSSVTATGLDRLVNLERWIQLFFSLLVDEQPALLGRDDLLCPSCGSNELGFVASGPGLDGTPPVMGFACTHCEWEVTDHESNAAACCDEDGEMEEPSPEGQDPAPSAS
jgi:hypothetical protein